MIKIVRTKTFRGLQDRVTKLLEERADLNDKVTSQETLLESQAGKIKAMEQGLAERAAAEEKPKAHPEPMIIGPAMGQGKSKQPLGGTGSWRLLGFVRAELARLDVPELEATTEQIGWAICGLLNTHAPDDAREEAVKNSRIIDTARVIVCDIARMHGLAPTDEQIREEEEALARGEIILTPEGDLRISDGAKPKATVQDAPEMPDSWPLGCAVSETLARYEVPETKAGFSKIATALCEVLGLSAPEASKIHVPGDANNYRIVNTAFVMRNWLLRKNGISPTVVQDLQTEAALGSEYGMFTSLEGDVWRKGKGYLAAVPLVG